MAIALSLITSIAKAEPFAVVKAGKPAVRIVISGGASEAAKRGANEIKQFIQLMSGADVQIKNEPVPGKGAAIVVGIPPDAASAATLGEDGFILKNVGDKLFIYGPGKRGTMYGCYDFLEKLGVRFLTPKVTRYPKNTSLSLPQLSEIQTPAFEYREPFFTEARDKDWAARIRIVGNSPHLDDSTGGKIAYSEFVHTFDKFVPRRLYDEHPKYFPFIDGKRRNGYVQRCLTNPNVLKLTIEAVKKSFKDHPDATICSVSQNDTAKWCECDECKAITTKYGAHSGLYLWFVNQVAEAIEKDYPDKMIDTLAYQFTEAPPKDITPRKNVRIRLCPISCCIAHPFEKCADEHNKAYVVNLAAWSKITNQNLYIWHYNTNFANYPQPVPDFDEFPDSVKLYQRSGVKGIFFQGAYAAGGGGSDAELRSYVMAKCMWNPDVDSNAIVTEWMQGIYGSAAKPMRAWFDLLQSKARDPNQHVFIYDPPTAKYLSADVLAEGDKLFNDAEKLAVNDPTATEYISKNRLGLRYVKLMQKPQVDDEFTNFVRDVRKFGITHISEGKSVDDWEKAYLDKHAPKK